MGQNFKDFCMEHNTIHQPSTPHSQWQNGRVERQVGHIKLLLKKSKNEKSLSIEDVLIAVRDTPLGSDLPSPFELMFNRKVKTIFPVMAMGTPYQYQHTQAGERSVKSADRANTSRHEPNPLSVGQQVHFVKDPAKSPNTCTPATVTQQTGARSYVVTDNKGAVSYSRNIQHIHEDKAPAEPSNTINASHPEENITSNCDAPSPEHARPSRSRRPPERFKDYVVSK